MKLHTYRWVKELSSRSSRQRPPLKPRAQSKEEQSPGDLAPLPDTLRRTLEPLAARSSGFPVPRVHSWARHYTCRSRAIGADLIDLVGLRWHISRAIIEQLEVTAFVKGTAQVGFPLGGVSLIHPLCVFPRLFSPGLWEAKRTADYRGPELALRP